MGLVRRVTPFMGAGLIALVAFADPTDNKAILEVEKAISRNVAPQSAPALELRRAIESAYYSLELRDDGTSEFQVTGLGGTVKKVQVRGRPQAQLAEEDLPELSDAELEPIAEPVESAPPPVSHPPASFRVAPRSTASVTPVPAPSGGSESGEEALRMVWVLADLLIEQGHFTRAELMKRLRAK